MNPEDDALLAYIRRACKYNTKRLCEDPIFFETLQRTPPLCIQLPGYAVERLDDKKHPGHDGRRLGCSACRQLFTLHSSHIEVTSGFVCGADTELSQVRNATSGHDCLYKNQYPVNIPMSDSSELTRLSS